MTTNFILSLYLFAASLSCSEGNKTIILQTNTDMKIILPLDDEGMYPDLQCLDENGTPDSLYYLHNRDAKEEFYANYRKTLFEKLGPNFHSHIRIIYWVIVDWKSKQIGYTLQLPPVYDNSKESALIEEALKESIESNRNAILARVPPHGRYYYFVDNVILP